MVSSVAAKTFSTVMCEMNEDLKKGTCMGKSVRRQNKQWARGSTSVDACFATAVQIATDEAYGHGTGGATNA